MGNPEESSHVVLEIPTSGRLQDCAGHNFGLGLQGCAAGFFDANPKQQNMRWARVLTSIFYCIPTMLLGFPVLGFPFEIPLPLAASTLWR